MNKKTKTRLIGFVLLLAIVGLCVSYLARFGILRLYDAARLDIFAHRIASADRVVGIWADSPVALTFTGDDAQKIVRAVSSAASARMPDKEIALKYSGRATFYRSTNVLGHILFADSLFLLKTTEPPFGSRLVDTMMSTPLMQAEREYWRTNLTKL